MYKQVLRGHAPGVSENTVGAINTRLRPDQPSLLGEFDDEPVNPASQQDAEVESEFDLAIALEDEIDRMDFDEMDDVGGEGDPPDPSRPPLPPPAEPPPPEQLPVPLPDAAEPGPHMLFSHTAFVS